MSFYGEDGPTDATETRRKYLQKWDDKLDAYTYNDRNDLKATDGACARSRSRVHDRPRRVPRACVDRGDVRANGGRGDGDGDAARAKTARPRARARLDSMIDDASRARSAPQRTKITCGFTAIASVGAEAPRR